MLATLGLGTSTPTTSLFVPLAAVIRPAGDSTGYAVYLVQDSGGAAVARLRPVTLGDVSGNRIAVKEGLTPGERVIVRGATIEANGQALQVMP
jgi:multidrug efflux pump subunit AcrA (membrane-fusion protein)